MEPDDTRTRRQFIGSGLAVAGLGIAGLSRLGRAASTAVTADSTVPSGGVQTGASANAAARRMRFEVESELAFPVDPAGGLHVLNNFGGRSVSLGPCGHNGIDIFVVDGSIGRPLLACTDAILHSQRFAPESGAQGNAWVLEDANGDVYRYHHLDAFEDGLEVGMPVARHQVIGYMGISGNANFAHLHFEVRRGGTTGEAVDPVPLLPFPIPEVTLGEFTGCGS